MKNIIKAIIVYLKKLVALRHILKQKNLQILSEREKYQAEKAANSILSAYVFYLASERGVIRVPKAVVSDLLGKCEVIAYSEGGDYVIEAKRSVSFGKVETSGKAGQISGLV